jgi:hypothetical protein
VAASVAEPGRGGARGVSGGEDGRGRNDVTRATEARLLAAGSAIRSDINARRELRAESRFLCQQAHWLKSASRTP